MTPDMLVEGFAMSPAPSSMPTGTVTLLMTDVEGSTRGWEAQPELMRTAMVRQLEVLATVVEAHGGFRPEEQGEGDSVVAAFARASDAVAAALDAQRALLAELGDVFRVRMALHTDEVLVRNERNYAGPALNRAARLRACGHGGQILVSGTTAELVGGRLPEGVSLIPLGRHRLRDLNRPEEVWQLAAPDLPSLFPPLQSLDAFATNLPVELTSLIGRVQELEELGPFLTDPDIRLITLTGPGGVGKTRLALQVARDNAVVFADGVWWAQLAPVSREDLAAATIARGMGLREAAGLSPLVQIQTFLGDKRALVVVDNCEHLVDACAHVADELLRTCPGVTVLATSREPLGTAGETVWRVPSLSLPSGPEEASPEALGEFDAVRLFVQRARQARPHFELSTANAAAVLEICRRLDGIPLALELAAARVRTLAVERVAAELHERFHLLTGGARTAVPRQQTLLASVDWSHDLLSDQERILLRRLAVFVGTFTVEAAEAVTVGDDLDRYHVMDLLGQLADKSLVQFDEVTGRYSLLETIRHYALDRCRAADELERQRDRHLHWAVEFLEARDCALCDRPVFEAIDAEYANIRAALQWASEHNVDHALRVAGALARYWTIAGRQGDALGLGNAVLAAARSEDPVRWARLVSLLAFQRVQGGGDPEFIRTALRPALEIARQSGDSASEAGCLYALGLGTAGESAQFERAFEVAQQSGNERFTIWSALAGLFSVIGTEPAEALFKRVVTLAANFDDGTFHFLLLGLMAQHAAMRGQQTEATRLARLALQHENKSLTPAWNTTAAVMLTALQGDDRELMCLAAEHFRPELREHPQSKWWVQLFEAAGALAEPDRTSSSFPVPTALFNWLAVSDLVARVLLADGRLDDAAAWARQVPASWPAAHASASLALAWVAVQRNDPDAAQLTHDALTEAADLGLRPFAAEALDLVASQWADGASYLEAARLLGAAAAARAEMGLKWRYPYHQAAVDATGKRARDALGEEAFEAALWEGADTSLEEAIHMARHVRRTPLTH